jgi:trehalose 6-phosphate synthase
VYLPDDRTVTAGSYPISIDAQELQELARAPETVERALEIRAELGDPEVLLLGVDRLDYTKGIRQRIRAVGELMAEGRLEQAETGFIQVATPSRERVDEYRRLRDDIDRLVGRINGDLGSIGHPAVTYLHSSFPKSEMAALYSAADVMIVTPLRDGMNLVAKEYVACRERNDGALVLSEFAGAAQELTQAFMVNPYDINGLKDCLMQAVEAPARDRTRRMRAMRKQVFEHDIGRWADSFLNDLRDVKPPHGKTPRPV